MQSRRRPARAAFADAGISRRELVRALRLGLLRNSLRGSSKSVPHSDVRGVSGTPSAQGLPGARPPAPHSRATNRGHLPRPGHQQTVTSPFTREPMADPVSPQTPSDETVPVEDTQLDAHLPTKRMEVN